METLNTKFGKTYTCSFRKGNTEISFRFEMAWNGNLYEDRKSVLVDVEKCNEDISDCILKELFEVDPLFDLHKYECFYSNENGAVYILDDENKLLISVNLADFVKSEKISYSTIN